MLKENISFILINPKEPGNIGASARAIKNMGFRNLELVNPCDHLTGEAYALAHGAEDVLESATLYDNFFQSIKEKSLVVATSGISGKRRGLILPIREGAKKIAEYSQKNRVAILFGRETKGLLNEEIGNCGFIIKIATCSSQPSLNLSQAVMITAYELSQYHFENKFAPEMAPHHEHTKLYARIKETIGILGYSFRGSEDLESGIMLNMRHLIGRYGLTEWELKMLHGLCSRIKKKLGCDP